MVQIVGKGEVSTFPVLYELVEAAVEPIASTVELS
jgi:hypothetical protein